MAINNVQFVGDAATLPYIRELEKQLETALAAISSLQAFQKRADK